MSSTTREDRAQERAIDKSFEETKDSAKKVLREVIRELPEVTSTFHDYQEQNIAAIRQMTNTFLDSQKEVAKSMQYVMRPYNSNPLLWVWPWMHPQILVDTYIKIVSGFADSTISGAKMATDLMQVAIESTRHSIDAAQENTKAISNYFVESARALEEEAAETPRRR